MRSSHRDVLLFAALARLPAVGAARGRGARTGRRDRRRRTFFALLLAFGGLFPLLRRRSFDDVRVRGRRRERDGRASLAGIRDGVSRRSRACRRDGRPFRWEEVAPLDGRGREARRHAATRVGGRERRIEPGCDGGESWPARCGRAGRDQAGGVVQPADAFLEKGLALTYLDCRLRARNGNVPPAPPNGRRSGVTRPQSCLRSRWVRLRRDPRGCDRSQESIRASRAPGRRLRARSRTAAPRRTQFHEATSRFPRAQRAPPCRSLQCARPPYCSECVLEIRDWRLAGTEGGEREEKRREPFPDRPSPAPTAAARKGWQMQERGRLCR